MNKFICMNNSRNYKANASNANFKLKTFPYHLKKKNNHLLKFKILHNAFRNFKILSDIIKKFTSSLIQTNLNNKMNDFY